MQEASEPIELLLSVTRDAPETLGAQIETQLRATIPDATLRGGTRPPAARYDFRPSAPHVSTFPARPGCAQ